MPKANRSARKRSDRVAPELPRFEELDEAETGRFGRLDLDESLYELTVLPLVRVKRRAKPPIPPLPRIGADDDDPSTDIVAPSTLQRLRAEAKGEHQRPGAPEGFRGLWNEVVGPEEDDEAPSGVRTIE